MRILILGAGGIGGYFGGRMAAAGLDVTFLVRPVRAQKLALGLVIESPKGDANIPPRIVTEVERPFDLVLVSCKAYDLDAAMDAVRPAVGDGTLVLPLLNGIAHLDKLDARFGAMRVLGGLAHISVTLGPKGEIKHLNKLETLTFGPREPSQEEHCRTIEALLGQAPFETRRSDKVVQEMWEKFAFITAAAATACLMRASVRDIMATDDGERLTRQMIEECNAVAAASGYAIRQKAQDWAVPFLTDRRSAFKPSMLQDLERGGKIEADHLQGDMIRRGRARGVATQLLEVAFCNVQAYQARQDAGDAG